MALVCLLALCTLQLPVQNFISEPLLLTGTLLSAVATFCECLTAAWRDARLQQGYVACGHAEFVGCTELVICAMSAVHPVMTSGFGVDSAELQGPGLRRTNIPDLLSFQPRQGSEPVAMLLFQRIIRAQTKRRIAHKSFDITDIHEVLNC